MKTKIVYDNSGAKREVFQNLKIGTILTAHKTIRCLMDGGTISCLWEGDRIEEGKEYPIVSISHWSYGSDIPCVIDEDRCTTWAEPSIFKLK